MSKRPDCVGFFFSFEHREYLGHAGLEGLVWAAVAVAAVCLGRDNQPTNQANRCMCFGGKIK